MLATIILVGILLLYTGVFCYLMETSLPKCLAFGLTTVFAITIFLICYMCYIF